MGPFESASTWNDRTGEAVIAWASAVSRYRHDVRILTDDVPQTDSRMLPCWCARNALHSGLTLLGVPSWRRCNLRTP
jgi:hypothetical protein